VLSVFLRFTASDYPCGIFKLFLLSVCLIEYTIPVIKVVFQLLFKLNFLHKIFKDNIRSVTFDLDYWKLDHLIICLSNDIQYSWVFFGGSIKCKLLHAAWLPEITILTKVDILFQCLSTIAFKWIQTAREPHPTPVPLQKLTPSFSHSEQLSYSLRMWLSRLANNRELIGFFSHRSGRTPHWNLRRLVYKICTLT
jgi:hypothetical protein